MTVKKYLRSYPITCCLALLILVYYGIMTLAGGTENIEVLIRFGAKVRPLIEAGQYWRLLTANIIHIGITHLLFNTYSLLWVGALAENLFSRWRYSALLLASGVASTLVSFFGDTAAISAGLSGVIFGLLGAVLTYGWGDARLRASGTVSMLLLLIGVNFALGLLSEQVDNYGHFGGLIAGLLLGGFFRWRRYAC